MHLKLGALEVLSTKIFFKEFEKSKFQTHWENAHIKSVSFMEPIVALNQIIEQCHKINLSFVRIKVPKESKSYLLCYEWKEWPNNLNDLIDLNNISENSIWRHILISSWCHSYNVIDVRRFNDMCPLPLRCSNDSQTSEWKILEETQKRQMETQIIQKKHREK